MALTPEQQRLREGKLTASAIGCLMTGDADKLLDLWRFMVGDPDYVEPDLSRIWPVQLGVHTEALNLDWYEYRTGRKLLRRGEVVTHPQYPWACCTLDGFDEALPGPVDAKYVGGFEPRTTVVARYTPQMFWQMDCTTSQASALSIIEGGREPVVEPVEWDADYSAELWRRAEAFMQCVWSLTPPIAPPAVTGPVAAVKEIDMSGSNWWTEQAAAWLKTHKHARSCEVASKELKKLVPADARRAFGAGIEIIRDRANRLSVKELTI